jgi:serine phosphatase RsbU (regulator of sigma subunit)
MAKTSASSATKASTGSATAADDLNRALEALQVENQRLSRAVQELSILNELSVVIGSMLNSNQVIEIVVKRSLHAVNAEQGTITMFDQAAVNPLKTLIRAADTSSKHERFHLDQSVAGWMQIHKRPLRSNDLDSDTRFSGVKIADNIRSILCAPLLVKNKLIGVLSVFNKKQPASGVAEFDEHDERLLAIIAGQSAQVIETARLYESEIAMQAMERELSAAREVQRNLLPQHLPEIAGIDLAASSTPAHDVGGDYYDVIPLGDDRYCILLADVSGKGLPAALVSTMVKGIFWAQIPQHQSPQDILQTTNVLLRNILPHSTFVTIMLAILDARHKSLELCSAGQCPPLYFGAKRAPEYLKMTGHPMNWLETPSFDSLSMKLRPGETLVLYSDGVIEAQNEMDIFYGAPALLTFAESLCRRPAQDIHDAIVAAINEFTGHREPADDLTLVVIRAT